MHSPSSRSRSHVVPHGGAVSTLLLAMFSALSLGGCADEADAPDIDLGEAVSALSGPWVSEFGYNAGGWRVERHLRMAGDVNGDGKDDVVGFADNGVYVSISAGIALTYPTRWIANFGYNAGGWRVDRHPRMLADVNGDGKDDVIGFADNGVHVAASVGTAFAPPLNWSSFWGRNTWGDYPRVMGDVNGDGKADVIGFGYQRVYVTLALQGGNFGPPDVWQWDEFTALSGWSSSTPRMVADVSGDGKGDVIGFDTYGPLVANGSTSPNGFVFSPFPQWSFEFGDADGWSVGRHPRMMGDVNGDGKSDVIGFSDDGPYVALSTGSAFGASSLWANEFGYDAGGWRVERHPRVMGDMDGDGKQDVVGFANDGVHVALSTGTSFSP